MKRLVSAIALLAAAGATPAFAQDGGIEVYGGVLVGYDSVKLKVPGESATDDGVVYGGVLGAQSDLGSTTLVGVEAEVTGSTTKDTVNGLFVAGDEARIKAGRDLFLGARLGFRAAPDLLVYAKGGYTNARINVRYTAPVGSFNESDNLDGYRVGAGVEFGVEQIRFRGEYRFSDYGEYKVSGVNTGLSAQRHQIVLGAIYAF